MFLSLSLIFLLYLITFSPSRCLVIVTHWAFATLIMLHLSSQLRCDIIVPSCVSYSNVRHILSMELVVRYSSLFNGDSADLFKSQSFVPWNPLVNNCKFLLLVWGCLWAWDQFVFGGRRLTLDGKNKTRISTRCQVVQQVQQSIVCVYIQSSRGMLWWAAVTCSDQ